MPAPAVAFRIAVVNILGLRGVFRLCGLGTLDELGILLWVLDRLYAGHI